MQTREQAKNQERDRAVSLMRREISEREGINFTELFERITLMRLPQEQDSELREMALKRMRRDYKIEPWVPA